jgi:predicted RNase H-like HicB family nuclease
MKLYKLPFTIHGPDADDEKLYRAEVPLLNGCRAWGDTPAEALENLQSVATAFIESYKENGYTLPAEIEALAVEAQQKASSEIVVAA